MFFVQFSIEGIKTAMLYVDLLKTKRGKFTKRNQISIEGSFLYTWLHYERPSF